MHVITTQVFPPQVAIPPVQDVEEEQVLRYCPSMDLVATFNQRKSNTKRRIDAQPSENTDADPYADEIEYHVNVYRLNGQKVFSVSIDSENHKIGIADVAWRQDGVILAISTTDNTTRLVNSFSGKVVHTFSFINPALDDNKSTTSSPPSKRKSNTQAPRRRKKLCVPTSMSYSAQFLDPTKARTKLDEVQRDTETMLDDLLGLNADIEKLLEYKADLPKTLVSIDMEQMLPKLVPLPPQSGTGEDIFSSKASIDAVFHPTKSPANSEKFDMLLVAQSNAHIHMRIFDSFQIGDIDMNEAIKDSISSYETIEQIMTHPFSRKTYVLATCSTIEPSTPSRHTRSHDNDPITSLLSSTSLELLSVDPKFLEASDLYLPIFATKSTQLNSLSRYLCAVSNHLTTLVRTSFDLPARFIRTLEEDLVAQDGEGSTFELAAYNNLLIGELHGKFKEWLAEILGDRGVKRWEKAVGECLEKIRQMMLECWVPAVERAMVVISRLTGLSGAERNNFGVDQNVLKGLRDTIEVMAVCGDDSMVEVCQELKGFQAFIKWLKQEVEAAGLEDTSEKLEEMREASEHSEVRDVMSYIDVHVKNSSATRYVRDEKFPVDLDDQHNFYKAFEKDRKALREGWLPPSLSALVDRLKLQCEILFSQTAAHLLKGVQVEHVCTVPEQIDTTISATRLVYELEYPVLHIAGLNRSDQNAVTIASLKIENPAPATFVMRTHKLGDVQIKDVNFADDTKVLVLAHQDNIDKILALPCGEHSHEQSADAPAVSFAHVFEASTDDFTKNGFVPKRLEVNSRKGRRAVAVLDEEGKGFAVYDLDSGDAEDDEGDQTMKNT